MTTWWLVLVILLASGLYLLGGLHELRRRVEKLEDRHRKRAPIDPRPAMTAEEARKRAQTERRKRRIDLTEPDRQEAR